MRNIPPTCLLKIARSCLNKGTKMKEKVKEKKEDD